MGNEQHDLIDFVVAVLPATEKVVVLEHVDVEDGVFVAIAEQGNVNIGWVFGCNDYPVVGQSWLVRILGFDLVTGIKITQALIRED